MKFRFPIVIIDEDFRSENTSGLGIRALAAAMEKEGWKLEDVPSAGEQAMLCGGMNLSTGGTARDVTDGVHPMVKSMCERAARVSSRLRQKSQALGFCFDCQNDALNFARHLVQQRNS